MKSAVNEIGSSVNITYDNGVKLNSTLYNGALKDSALVRMRQAGLAQGHARGLQVIMSFKENRRGEGRLRIAMAASWYGPVYHLDRRKVSGAHQAPLPVLTVPLLLFPSIFPTRL